MTATKFLAIVALVTVLVTLFTITISYSVSTMAGALFILAAIILGAAAMFVTAIRA